MLVSIIIIPGNIRQYRFFSFDYICVVDACALKILDNFKYHHHHDHHRWTKGLMN